VKNDCFFKNTIRILSRLDINELKVKLILIKLVNVLLFLKLHVNFTSSQFRTDVSKLRR